MKVYFASDHAGFELKAKLIEHVRELGYEAEDCGALTYDADDDYPDFIAPCAKKVAADLGSFGIVLGASGQGEAMCANRVKGARCALYYGAPAKEQTDMDGNELDMIASTRAHNDANMLSLGGRFLLDDEAKAAVEKFLATPFSNAERHLRRIKKLDD
ncbi:MAG: RpiB/LacA/LacB family sugar-phosphate isomerase [Patescibacteria group bacterium]|nr:RpiB/LacA/LacB family sugar-phosphate isomerase [Patescibacteria group bacterium]